MISLGRSLIANLNGKNITIKRDEASGQYIEGRWVESVAVTRTIFGSVQPLGPKEIVRLAEGDRTRQRLKIYSADKALISRDIILKEADKVVIGCDEFQVESVEEWPTFWKIQIVRINVNGDEQ